ncbi:hypothetical protein MKW92_043051 [Papaver armeniacum]|nr:hypothetical protein MKW92_043051 [Papaver armeniacum]
MKYFSMLSCFIFFYIFTFSSIIVQGNVPISKTFKLLNQGPISSSNAVELGAEYRVLNIPDNNKSNPFSLCFYTIPPSNTFMLGIGVGKPQFNTVFRWVWTANLTRHVRENATLVFGLNGNLVLVDFDGRVAWQTGTANKGIVDIKLLSNGNLVLLDKNGAFVWQSFHYPTDTLLVGQSLSRGMRSSNNKLVNGAYSMVLEEHLINLYYKSPLSRKPVAYYGVTPGYMGNLQNVTFKATHWSDGSNHLVFQYEPNGGQSGWAEPKYNAILSLFRLGSDGNLRIFSYDKSRQLASWDTTFTRFSNAWKYASECMLPEKCGSLGICENNKCVSCPTPNGLKSWTRDCKPSKLPSCPTNKIAPNSNVSYYKVEGVDHFMANSEINKGEGPVKMEVCKKKCSDDCECMAFFYRKDSLRCLLTAQLNTLNKVIDSSNTLSANHIAFIKYAK